MSIRWKYVIYFFIIVVVIIVSTSIYIYNFQIETLISEKENSFKSMINFLSSSIANQLLTVEINPRDRIAIIEQLTEVTESGITSLEGLVLLSRKNRIIFSKFKDKELENFINPETAAFSKQNIFIQKRITFKSQPFEILYKTIFFKQQNKEIPIGHIIVVFSLKEIYDITRNVLYTLILITGIALLISILMIFILSSLITKRIFIILESVKALSKGKFKKMPVKGKDEIGVLMDETNRMIEAVKQRILLSRYVSKSTLDYVSSTDNIEVDFHGKNKDVVIFFSDVRGFTHFSEKHKPEEVVKYLNTLFDMEVEIIQKYKGEIDKFIGDAVMAIFEGKDAESRAYKAAVDIQKKLKSKNFVLKIGIGITKGKVIWGNIGSKDRLDATYIGDRVNTASRLCSVAKEGEIVIDENLKEKINVQNSEGPFKIKVKGKEEEIMIYRIKI